MNDDRSQSDEDALDALLRDARWPAALPGTVERLALGYHIQSQRERWRTATRIALPLAASIALAVGAAAWWSTQSAPVPGAVASKTPPQPPTAATTGREPTFYERYLAQKDEKKVRTTARGEVKPAPLPPPQVEKIAAKPAVDPSLWAAMIRHPNMETRFAAARDVGRAADIATLQQLALMLDDAAMRRAALLALMSSGEPYAASILHRAEKNPTLASQIAALRHEQESLASKVAQSPRPVAIVQKVECPL